MSRLITVFALALNFAACTVDEEPVVSIDRLNPNQNIRCSGSDASPGIGNGSGTCTLVSSPKPDGSINCGAKYCLEYDHFNYTYTPGVSPGTAMGRTFYAHNFASLEEAQREQKKASKSEQPIESQIVPRFCAELLESCPAEEKPVCGSLKNGVQKTYRNFCELKNEIRRQAGDSGDYRGSWVEGACLTNVHCGQGGSVCVAKGEKCLYDPNLPKGRCVLVDCYTEMFDRYPGLFIGEAYSVGCFTCSCDAPGTFNCWQNGYCGGGSNYDAGPTPWPTDDAGPTPWPTDDAGPTPWPTDDAGPVQLDAGVRY